MPLFRSITTPTFALKSNGATSIAKQLTQFIDIYADK